MNICIDTSWDNYKAIQRVYDLHTPYTYQGNEYCNECFDEYGEHAAYPCTTIDVLGDKH